MNGARGGRETVKRHGIQHMREIGKRGFEATVARHWAGDRQGFRDYLGLRRHEAQLENFVDRELQRRLDQGAEVASVELPVLSEPDEFPF